jgi:hypothetical protein
VESKTIEKLDEVGEKTLVWLEEFSENGIEFIEEQAPLLCNEILRLALVSPSVWICVAVMVIALCIYFYKHANVIIPITDRCSDSDKEAITCVRVAFKVISVVVALVFSTVCIPINIYDMLCVIVAPRVYLIEYFADLYQKVN